VFLFTKTNAGGTDEGWFYNREADGFSLDDKRMPLDSARHEKNDLPDIIARWKNRAGEASRKRTEQSFFVPILKDPFNFDFLMLHRDAREREL